MIEVGARGEKRSRPSTTSSPRSSGIDNGSVSLCLSARPLYEAEAKERERLRKSGDSGNISLVGQARDLAGHMIGVSGRYISDAKKIIVALLSK